MYHPLVRCFSSPFPSHPCQSPGPRGNGLADTFIASSTAGDWIPCKCVKYLSKFYSRFTLLYYKPLFIYLLASASELMFIYRTLTEHTFYLPYIGQTIFRFTLLCYEPLLSTFIYLTLNKPTFYLPYFDQTIFWAWTYDTFSLLRVKSFYCLCTHLQHCLVLVYLTLANPISVYPRVTTLSMW
jgi:hypothetical protein